MPRVQSWLDHKFPEAYAAAKLLKETYPDKKVSFKDTTRVMDGQQQRALTVTVSGKDYLDAKQSETAKEVICHELGDKNQYDIVALQNAKERNILFFFFKEGRTEPVICNP